MARIMLPLPQSHAIPSSHLALRIAHCPNPVIREAQMF